MQLQIAMDHHRSYFKMLRCFLIQAISLTRDIALYHSAEPKSLFGWPFMCKGMETMPKNQTSTKSAEIRCLSFGMMHFRTFECKNLTVTSDRIASKWDGLIFVPASKWLKHRTRGPRSCCAETLLLRSQPVTKKEPLPTCLIVATKTLNMSALECQVHGNLKTHLKGLL